MTGFRATSNPQIGAHVQIPFRIRDLNALLTKQPPDLVEDFALDVVHAVVRVLYPDLSSSSIAVSPNAMISALGAGMARTRAG